MTITIEKQGQRIYLMINYGMTADEFAARCEAADANRVEPRQPHHCSVFGCPNDGDNYIDGIIWYCDRHSARNSRM